MGFIQARWGHLNETESLVTRFQAIGIDGHFMVEQWARNTNRLFMNFNGTAGVFRKAAIIDAGNWQGDTLTERLEAPVTGFSVVGLNDTEVEEVVEAFSELRNLAANPRSRELLRRPVVIDLLLRGGVSGIPLSDAEAMEAMKRSYGQIIEVAEAYEMTISIEVHGYFTTKPEMMEKMLAFCDSKYLRMNMDTGNTFIAGQDAAPFLERFKDKVSHVHIKDVSESLAAASRGELTGIAVSHCAIGDGVNGDALNILSWGNIVDEF